MKRGGPVQQRGQFLLLLPRAQSGFGRPVNIIDSRDPHPAKLARRRRRQIHAGGGATAPSGEGAENRD